MRNLSATERHKISAQVERQAKELKNLLERQIRAKTKNRAPKIRSGIPSIEFKQSDVEILLKLVDKGYGDRVTNARGFGPSGVVIA